MDRRTLLGGMTALSASMFTPWPASAGEGKNLKGFIRTNWSKDPFAHGAYSYIPKGAGRGDIKALEKPINGRIFFAGEATFPKRNSTVHAAYESGQRVAGFVLEENAHSVAVIGAGMSGLSAAHKLAAQGKSVTVFEARDRIGGRILTDSRLGFPVDLGASWIHGTKDNPLVELSDRVGQERIETYDSFLILGRDEKTVPYTEVPPWLNDVVGVQNVDGVDPGTINKWAYMLVDDYDGKEVIFKNGYAPILGALKSDYEVRLSSQVTKIKQHDKKIEIETQNNLSEKFDAVIVTLPLGVLKENVVEFLPALPKRKQRAIDKLDMGVLDKLYLLFDEPFWDIYYAWIVTLDNGLPPGYFNMWLNLHQALGQPVLVAFNGGTPARELSKLSDEVLVKKAMSVLDLTFSS